MKYATKRIYNYEDCTLLEFKADKISLGDSPKKNSLFTDKKIALAKDDIIYFLMDLQTNLEVILIS